MTEKQHSIVHKGLLVVLNENGTQKEYNGWWEWFISVVYACVVCFKASSNCPNKHKLIPIVRLCWIGVTLVGVYWGSVKTTVTICFPTFEIQQPTRNTNNTPIQQNPTTVFVHVVLTNLYNIIILL